MKKILVYSIILLLTSCSTLNETLIYSSMSGALVGGYIGRESSPNKKSENLNTVIGATVGAATTSLISYYFYKDAKPDLKMKNSELEKKEIVPIEDLTLGLEKINLSPKFNAISEKEYMVFSKAVPSDVKKFAKKQYFKRYKTEPYTFEKEGKKYQIPSFDFIESGLE